MKLVYASILFYVTGYLIWVFFGQENQTWYNLYYIWDKTCLLLALLSAACLYRRKRACILLYTIVAVQALRIVYEFIELFGGDISLVAPKYLAVSMLIGGIAVSVFFFLDRQKT